MTKVVFAFTMAFIAVIGIMPVTAKEVAKAAKLDIRPEAKAMRDAVSQTCQSCHVGQGKNVKKFGDFFEDGVLQKYVDRRDPKNSLLYKKIASKEMPKDDNGDELDDGDRAEFLKAIEKWIVAGTPSLEGNKEIDFVNPKEILETIASDLKVLKAKVPLEEFQNFRYFSFLPIYNHGRRRANLPLFTQALSKLVNSLSWQPKIVVPKQIDRRGIVFRINLKDYGWDEVKWSEVVGVYPHLNEYVANQGLSDEIKNTLNTSTSVVVRGDWFITETSKPPFYHFLLDMPGGDGSLEDSVGINVSDNIFNAKVDRAGFVDSGVSQNNRIIERHKSKFGAYWKSYDFANSIQEKNIMERPLGPFLSDADSEAGASAFDHDGGEIIFNLPNGLQAYMLVNDGGVRIDKGPIEIVSDPSRPDRLVTNGVSCMGCHNRGIILKSDQINDTFASAPAALRARVSKFYGNPKFLNLMENDQQVFLAAQGLAKVSQVSPEVVSTAVAIYESTIDRQGLAAELNLTKTELDGFVSEAGQFSDSLKSFYRQTTTSTIKRDSFDRFAIRDLSDVLNSVVLRKVENVQNTILKVTEDDGNSSRVAAELVLRNQMPLDLYISLRKNKFDPDHAQRLAKRGKAAGDLAIKARKKHKDADLNLIVFFVESGGTEVNLERFLKLTETLSPEEALEVSAKKDVDVAKYLELRTNEFDKDQALKIISSKKFLAGTLTNLQRLGISRDSAIELAVDTDRAILAVELIGGDRDADILLLSDLAVKSKLDVKTYLKLRKVATVEEAKDAALLVKKKEISADKYIEYRTSGLEHAEVLKGLKNDKFAIGNFKSLRSQGVGYEEAFALTQDPKLAAAALKYLSLGNRPEGDLAEIAKLISEGTASPETLNRLKDVAVPSEAQDVALRISKKQFSEVDYTNVRKSGLGHQESLEFLKKAAAGKSDVNVYLRMRKTGLADAESQEISELVTGKKLTEKNYLALRVDLEISHEKSVEFAKTKEGVDGVQFIAKNSPDRGDDIVETANLWSKKELDISKYLKIRKSPGVRSGKEAREAATQVEKQAINQEFYQGLRKEGFTHPDALFLSTSNLLNTAATRLKLENTELSPTSIRFLVEKINSGKDLNIPKFTWIMKANPNFNMEIALRISAPAKEDETPIFKNFLINSGLSFEDIESILNSKTFFDVYQREMLKTKRFSLEEIILLSEDVRGEKFLDDVKEIDQRISAEDAAKVAIAAGRNELDIDTYADIHNSRRVSRDEAIDSAKLVKSKKLDRSDYLKLREKGISHSEALKLSQTSGASSNTIRIESSTRDNFQTAAQAAINVANGEFSAETYIRLRGVADSNEAREAAKLIKNNVIDEGSYRGLRGRGLNHKVSLEFAKSPARSNFVLAVEKATRDTIDDAVAVSEAASKGEFSAETYIRMRSIGDRNEAIVMAKLIDSKSIDEASYSNLRKVGIGHEDSLALAKDPKVASLIVQIEKNSLDSGRAAIPAAKAAAGGELDAGTYIQIRNVANETEAIAAAKLVKAGTIDESLYLKLRQRGLAHERAIEGAKFPDLAASALEIENQTNDKMETAFAVAVEAKKSNFSFKKYIELRRRFTSTEAIAGAKKVAVQGTR